ncbi:RidA family protein [Deinococcus misasensis]|uniref:RidA family protein n=1 Tax=Deinococcus misasensis TaxID=392413 RepID=UPI00054DB6D8|nr:RidA family protein [Deinococcus misasensis]
MSDQKRINFSGSSPLEPVIGYSRVVRVGNIVHVAGTTATDSDGSGRIVGVGDMYLQTRQTLRNIQRALEAAGVELKHVVRTRMFVTDISRWEEVGRAHGEFFSDIRPVAAMYGIQALVHPDMLVEIEVEAIVTDA